MHRATLIVSIVLSTIAGAEETPPQRLAEDTPAVAIDSDATGARLTEVRSETFSNLVHQQTRLMEELPGQAGVTALLVMGGCLSAASAVLWAILGFGGGLARLGTGGTPATRIALDILTIPAIVLASAFGLSGIALLVSGGVRLSRREAVLRELKEIDDALPFSQRVPLPDGR